MPSATAPEPARYPRQAERRDGWLPGSEREGRPGQLLHPQLVISSGVGLESFLLNQSVRAASRDRRDRYAGLVGPLVNKRAIRAQLPRRERETICKASTTTSSIILEAFTQVINRVSHGGELSAAKSIEIKKQQLASLESSVDVANNLFQNARTEYIEVLSTPSVDLRDARTVPDRHQDGATVRHRQRLSSPRRRCGDDFNAGGISRSIPRSFIRSAAARTSGRSCRFNATGQAGIAKATLGGQQERCTPTSTAFGRRRQAHHPSAPTNSTRQNGRTNSPRQPSPSPRRGVWPPNRANILTVPTPAARKHARPVRPEGDRRSRRRGHRQHQPPRGLAEPGDDGEVTGRFAHDMIVKAAKPVSQWLRAG